MGPFTPVITPRAAKGCDPYLTPRMALIAGTRLGPYEITRPLDAGGMGEVYRGTDRRLDRTVAIKIVASDIANVPELRARFEREV